MSKYVIELDKEQLLEYDKDTDTYFRTLYKAKGFNALVFDKHGLDKLTPLDKELDEAYQKGLCDGKARNEYGCIGCRYDDGTTEHSPCDYCCNAYSNQWTAKEKPDEIKASDIITDGKINYLVIDVTDKSYVALQGTDFEPVYIGKDYIKSYHNLHDSKDMRKIVEEIGKAVKSEQKKVCATCKYEEKGTKHSVCYSCLNQNRWELKEGAE